MGPERIKTKLRFVGQQKDEKIDLAETALLLAALDLPKVKIIPYRKHLQKMVGDVQNSIPSGAIHDTTLRAETLAKVIGNEMGYCGDTLTYNDPQNANFMRIIDRRKGLPVGLAIIYLSVAQKLKWNASGLNFPGHFLIRIGCGPNRMILNPFNKGSRCKASDLRKLLQQMFGKGAEIRPNHYNPASNRDTLIRLLNNTKIRAQKSSDFKRAVNVIERMLIIAPKLSNLLFEAGVFYARIGNLKSSANALEKYLTSNGQNIDQHAAKTLLQKVCSKLN
ncbi:MAG: transglutaminase-like domain-containing protein [Pseudomonadota bacterium]|nr:transglutaminase-like domain-containing protein [Pseudomonadota bacterium]